MDVVDVLVIVKETGSGLSGSVAEPARSVGVAAVDVGGNGGTSFASIESAPAAEAGFDMKARLGRTFASWGIPTPVAVALCAPVLPVIAIGGVRTGLDAARAIAIGATVVGVARHLLAAAFEQPGRATEWVEAFTQELRTAIFLTGGRRLSDLTSAPRVVTGASASWMNQLATGSGISAVGTAYRLDGFGRQRDEPKHGSSRQRLVGAYQPLNCPVLAVAGDPRTPG